MKKLEVGDLVKVNSSFLGSRPGELGYVYDTYPDFDDNSKEGACIILESGKDLGGFSYEEQEEYIEHVCTSNTHYEFTNVIRLSKDFDDGIFVNPFLIGKKFIREQKS